MSVLFALTSSFTHAQTFLEQQDELFQKLDKNKISTGVLYDRVYPLSGLNAI